VSAAGESLAPDDPHEAIKHGLAFIPADRRGRGAIMDMYARENLTLPRLAPHRRHLGRLDRRSERADAAAWADRVELSPPDPERPLHLFSGGNQQKVVIAKWLRNTPSVLLFDEPTQGVDVGAKAAIYKLIGAAAKDGAAVLVTSSDMKELASVCDRVIVMRDGVIAATLEKSALTEANLVSASLGMRQTEVAALFGELNDNEPGSGTQSNEAEVENA
jgi:ribose transport system ATP-binding protein